MAIQQRKQSSIILTFKVLQFVNQLRRRVKPRASNIPIKQLHLGTGVPLSHKGLRMISKELSCISIRDGKQARQVAYRVTKTRKNNAKRSPSDAPAASDSADELQLMLGLVDDMLNAGGTTFSSIASSDRLFLKHNSAPILEGCSLNQTVKLLVNVQDAIDVLVDCRSRYGDDWLLGQGLDAGLCMDENFIANYEHMLLRLREELIEALARKALEELLHGGHDKKQRKMLAWFTEFAEKPRPLSTSFPWTIKTSLAVLWGVCWMFYDNPPSEEAVKVRRNRVLQQLATDIPWNTPASDDYLELGRALIGSPPQHALQHQTETTGDGSLENDMFQARNTDTWPSDLNPSTFRLPRLQVSQMGANRPLPPSQVAAPQLGTYYPDAQDLYPIISPQNNYLPHFQGESPLTVFPHLGSESHNDPWQTSFLPHQQSPRHQLHSPQTPSIRVTGSSGTHFAQPPEYFASFDPSIYSPSRQPQASPLHLNTQFPFAQQRAMMGSNLSPDTATMQGSQIPVKHERNGSVHSIPTPVSNSGQLSPHLSPTVGERHTVSSPYHHKRHDSVSSSEQDGDDDGSLRKNYSYKRAEEPLKNQDGKMKCRHDECAGLLFDRKCEWSKHMDKHDRPYKCTVKGCEKLQGFTYSGGLLRHEREVHKLHGGTKKSLFCPFADCKRSSGTGFTRKENLAEHIRRVHRRTSMSADMHGLVIRRSTMEGSPAEESRVTSESPYNRAMDYQDDEEMTLKRKRGSDSGLSDRGNDEMRAEIKRLRHQNEEKDERLRQLEQAVMALQQNRR